MSTSSETDLNASDPSRTEAGAGTPGSAQANAFSGGTAWAGSELVNFQQAGRGRPVLMLAAGTENGTEPQLALALAERFRVVLPAIGRTDSSVAGTSGNAALNLGTPVAETIELFLDTLGFSSVTLVATPPYASAALAYALMDAERVERLVIFIDDRLRNGTPIPLLSDRLSDAGIPLAALAWPDSQPGNMRDSCVAAVIDEVTTFLSDETYPRLTPQ